MEANLSTESSTRTLGLRLRDLFVQDGRSTYSRLRDSPERCSVCLGFEKDVKINIAEAMTQASEGCGPCTIVNCIYELYQQNFYDPSTYLAEFCMSTSRIKISRQVYNIFTTSHTLLLYGKNREVSRPKDRTPLISDWIQFCILEHPGCNQAKSQLPTRVLDLDCPEGIKLCSGMEVVERYVALSHCWGNPPNPAPLNTTKATLLDRQTKINEDELTKTFQDAIALARRLSIRYMWADSLCIVQNDKNEWNKESAKMASIYENAYLVIAATEASHGGIGCSADRSGINDNSRLCFTHLTSQKEEIAIYVENCIDHSHFEQFSMSSQRPDQRVPLLYRAWCLQERLLATRVVHLTRSELFWECKSETLCECNKNPSRVSSVGLGVPASKIKQEWATCPYPFNLWHQTLTMYMHRDITRQSDRLSAVSGFAKRLQAFGAGDYIAGLWRRNLFADMIWEVEKGRRVDIWQAPSWSWACLKSGIDLTFCSTYRVLSTELLLAEWGLPEPYRSIRRFSGGPRLRTTLISFEINPLGSDSTGQIKSASLTISVPIVEVLLDGTQLDKFYITKDGAKVEFLPDDRRDFDIYEFGTPTELFCIWIGSIWPSHDIRPQLLVLRTSRGISGRPPTINAFERVGCICHYSYRRFRNEVEVLHKWFSEAQVQTIKLV